jgi:hypothetical protein
MLPVAGIVLLTCACFAQKDPVEVLKKMYDKYSGKWYHTITSTQIVERYHRCELNRVVTLFVATSFPDKFRIDYSDLAKGNAEIFVADSSFGFRHGRLYRSRKADDDVLNYLEGSYFFSPFDSLVNKMTALGIDINKYHEEKWKGKEMYVIGAADNNENKNQLWIEKERMVIARLIVFGEKQRDDFWFENYIRLGKAWKQTLVTYYSNDELLYKEITQNSNADPVLKESLFDPRRFGEWHWLKPKQ